MKWRFFLAPHFNDDLRLNGPFHEVLIIGDSAGPEVKSLDGLFKRLMEEEEK